MLLSLVCIFYTVSAQSIFSRAYLRGLKRLEDERLQAQLINHGIDYLETEVFKAAKTGRLSYTTNPFPGCQYFSRPSEISTNGLEQVVCENIVNEIKKLVTEHFPDSKLVHNEKDQTYTLYWD